MSASTHTRHADGGVRVDVTKLHVDVDRLHVHVHGSKTSREDAPLLTASSSSSTLYTVSRASSPGSASSTPAEEDVNLKKKKSRKQFEFPWGKVIVILVLNAVQPFAFELVFPFISAFFFSVVCLRSRVFAGANFLNSILIWCFHLFYSIPFCLSFDHSIIHGVGCRSPT